MFVILYIYLNKKKLFFFYYLIFEKFYFFYPCVRIFLVTNDVIVNFLKIWFVTVLKLYILNYKLQFRTLKIAITNFNFASMVQFFFSSSFNVPLRQSLFPFFPTLYFSPSPHLFLSHSLVCIALAKSRVSHMQLCHRV